MAVRYLMASIRRLGTDRVNVIDSIMPRLCYRWRSLVNTRKWLVLTTDGVETLSATVFAI